MKKRTRYYWIDIIKIIACFMVVVNHTGGFIFTFLDNNSFFKYNLFYSICFAVSKIGVPLFIMVSGYLLLGKDYSYKDVLVKIKRVVVPLVVISLY